MGAEKNYQGDQATGNTMPRVCDMFNLAKTKIIIYVADNLQMEKNNYGMRRRVSTHEQSIHDCM